MTNLVEIKLRRLAAGDAGIVREMLYWALFVPAGQPALPRSILEEPAIRHYTEGWGRAGDMGWSAQLDGRCVSAAWLRLFPASDPGYGFVAPDIPELSVATLPEFRGRGIGSRVMERLLDSARERFAGISLSVTGSNPARRWYERMGFVRQSAADGAWLMLKRL